MNTDNINKKNKTDGNAFQSENLTKKKEQNNKN